MQIFFLEKNLHVTQFWDATFLQYIKDKNIIVMIEAFEQLIKYEGEGNLSYNIFRSHMTLIKFVLRYHI